MLTNNNLDFHSFETSNKEVVCLQSSPELRNQYHRRLVCTRRRYRFHCMGYRRYYAISIVSASIAI